MQFLLFPFTSFDYFSLHFLFSFFSPTIRRIVIFIPRDCSYLPTTNTIVFCMIYTPEEKEIRILCTSGTRYSLRGTPGPPDTPPDIHFDPPWQYQMLKRKYIELLSAYCTPKKSCPFLYSRSLCKNG